MCIFRDTLFDPLRIMHPLEGMPELTGTENGSYGFCQLRCAPGRFQALPSASIKAQVLPILWKPTWDLPDVVL